MDLSFDLGRGPASYGHRFLIGLQPGHTLGDKDKRLLSLLKPAGVVLFRANFDTGFAAKEFAKLVGLELKPGDVVQEA